MPCKQGGHIGERPRGDGLRYRDLLGSVTLIQHLGSFIRYKIQPDKPWVRLPC